MVGEVVVSIFVTLSTMACTSITLEVVDPTGHEERVAFGNSMGTDVPSARRIRRHTRTDGSIFERRKKCLMLTFAKGYASSYSGSDTCKVTELDSIHELNSSELQHTTTGLHTTSNCNIAKFVGEV